MPPRAAKILSSKTAFAVDEYNSRCIILSVSHPTATDKRPMPVEQAAVPAGPANLTDLARLIDGAPLPVEQPPADRLLLLARFMHRLLADVHELTDPRSRTPLQDMQEIRVKTKAGLKEAARLGLLS
jgi:hypothetical protein